MLRATAGRLTSVLRGSLGLNTQRAAVGAVRHSSSAEPNIYDSQFDDCYVAFFDRPDIDSWEIRKGMNDLLGMDLVPEPKIIIAALKACRRLNDYALAVRWLEGCADKCGSKKAVIYPYLLQEIRPTLSELGISTPEEMGYGCPELAIPDVISGTH